MPFNWKCPHCGHAQSVADDKHEMTHGHFHISDLAEGSIGLTRNVIGCANQDCRKVTVFVWVGPDRRNPNGGFIAASGAKPFFSGYLYPRGAAKPQPDYIPAALREDYVEACLVRDLSPKAAATLARRCIQGMIRDFASVVKPTLFQEIEALRQLLEEDKAPRGVTPESVAAIHHVRGIGNIGAHMEKDIGLIVPVDAGEAQALIGLIEMLFEEWYVAQHRRQEMLNEIARIGDEKQALRAGGALRQPEDTKPADAQPGSEQSPRLP